MTKPPVKGTDVTETGMFMDAVRRGVPPPPAARTLGFEVIEVDPVGGHIEAAFDGTEAFTNPYGEVLGGFLAAMLYDTVGPALLATLGPGDFIVTHDLRVSFLRPARVGRLVGQGRVVGREGHLVHLAATLSDADGQPVATAQAVAEVVPREPPGQRAVSRCRQ
jgi:uncharacterized protein (TIGR00369 family)